MLFLTNINYRSLAQVIEYVERLQGDYLVYTNQRTKLYDFTTSENYKENINPEHNRIHWPKIEAFEWCQMFAPDLWENKIEPVDKSVLIYNTRDAKDRKYIFNGCNHKWVLQEKKYTHSDGKEYALWKCQQTNGCGILALT